MNQQKVNKFLILILLFMLSFGFTPLSLAQKYSDLQTKTTQTNIKRRAIYPSSYENKTDATKQAKKPEKKETFWDMIMKMVRALILIIALFLGIAAYIAKHKDKFKNIKLPNALKNIEIKPEPQSIEVQAEPEVENATPTPHAPLLSTRDNNIRELVFKFFDINK